MPHHKTEFYEYPLERWKDEEGVSRQQYGEKEYKISDSSHPPLSFFFPVFVATKSNSITRKNRKRQNKNEEEVNNLLVLPRRCFAMMLV